MKSLSGTTSQTSHLTPTGDCQKQLCQTRMAWQVMAKTENQVRQRVSILAELAQLPFNQPPQSKAVRPSGPPDRLESPQPGTSLERPSTQRLTKSQRNS